MVEERRSIPYTGILRPPEWKSCSIIFFQLAEELAQKRNLTWQYQLLARDEADLCDRELIALVEQEALALGYNFIHMNALAGFDAQVLTPLLHLAI